MRELAAVLSAFYEATRCAAAVWTQPEGATELVVEAAAPGGVRRPAFPPTVGEAPRAVHTADGEFVVAAIPGPRRAWIQIGPCPDPNVSLTGYLKFLLPVVAQYVQSALEVEHAANELAERYEEINLLYTISEILGRTVSLEEAAATILREISETSFRIVAAVSSSATDRPRISVIV